MRKFSKRWWAIHNYYKKRKKDEDLVTVSGYDGNLHIVDGEPWWDDYQYGYKKGDVIKRKDAIEILKKEYGNNWKNHAMITSFKKNK